MSSVRVLEICFFIIKTHLRVYCERLMSVIFLIVPTSTTILFVKKYYVLFMCLFFRSIFKYCRHCESESSTCTFFFLHLELEVYKIITANSVWSEVNVKIYSLQTATIVLFIVTTILILYYIVLFVSWQSVASLVVRDYKNIGLGCIFRVFLKFRYHT